MVYPRSTLRPITSFVQSPSYQLSRHLATNLSPLGNTDSHVTNSSEVASLIQEVNLAEEDIQVSFDVVSLFTCVPVELAVEVANQRLSLDEDLPNHTSLIVQEIMRLLSFCLNATCLSFHGEKYQQTFGTAMGSLSQ